jgi:hypothetical protein
MPLSPCCCCLCWNSIGNSFIKKDIDDLEKKWKSGGALIG